VRTFVFAAFILFSAVPLQTQQKHPHTNPGKTCGDQSAGLPDFYPEAVFAYIKPPGLERSVIRIVVGKSRKLVLWTNGEKFQLSTDTLDIPQENISGFLLDLDQSCRLPPDPKDAAALIKVNWEHKDLSAAQFAQLHNHFATALAQYVSKIRSRYSSQMSERKVLEYIHVEQFLIVYDNNFEHIEIGAWDLPENNVLNPMAAWVHELQKFATQIFHRQFG
jgi:hypothetical protein